MDCISLCSNCRKFCTKLSLDLIKDLLNTPLNVAENLQLELWSGGNLTWAGHTL